jgi:hypothetical protein
MAEQTTEQDKGQIIKCALVVGMREDGSVFVETHGTEQNLIILDGLVDYGKRYVEEQWAIKKIEAEAAKAKEAEEVEVEVIAPVDELKKKRKAAPKKVVDTK